MINKRITSVLGFAIVATLLITACDGAATATSTQNEILIAVPDGFNDEYLIKALTTAASSLGENIIPRIDTYRIPQGRCHGDKSLNLIEYDLYLLFSQSAPYAFSHYELEPVPDDILNSIEPFDQVNHAFANDNRVMAISQATEPVLLIYNPEITGNIPAQISLDEVLQIASSPADTPTGLAISAETSVGLAILESAIGDQVPQGQTLEDVVFKGEHMGLIRDVAPTLNEFFSDQNIDAPDNILDDFMQNKVGMVIATSDFLAELASKNYDKPIGITHVPMIATQGGSAHSLGWVVPEDRPNARVAWDLVQKLQNTDEIIQWALANGMFPANQTASNLWLDKSDLSNGLMAIPPADNGGVQELSNIAAEATPWYIPNYINMDAYNNLFLPLGDSLMKQVAHDKLNVSQALDMIADAQKNLGITP